MPHCHEIWCVIFAARHRHEAELLEWASHAHANDKMRLSPNSQLSNLLAPSIRPRAVPPKSYHCCSFICSTALVFSLLFPEHRVRVSFIQSTVIWEKICYLCDRSIIVVCWTGFDTRVVLRFRQFGVQQFQPTTAQCMRVLRKCMFGQTHFPEILYRKPKFTQNTGKKQR